MILKEKIKVDLKKALKRRKRLETSVLRMLLAAVVNQEKEKRAKIARLEPGLAEEELVKKSQLSDEEVVRVVFWQVKQRKEAIQGFKKGGRPELAEKEKQEMEILQKYLSQER